MMLSSAAKDSIRALIYIAINDKDYISVKEIATNLNLPFHFLSKNLQELVRKGILYSFRGPKGGLKFAKNPYDIKLIEIIEIIDGVSMFKECILGFKECSDEKPCAIHHNWTEKRESIYKMFSDLTIGKVAEDIKSGKLKNLRL